MSAFVIMGCRKRLSSAQQLLSLFVVFLLRFGVASFPQHLEIEEKFSFFQINDKH
eukprot:m.28995 g.28995  ORF g.28995 m.28995 type:complete len:55 (+) comp6112_c0_seq2:129-293(+)